MARQPSDVRWPPSNYIDFDSIQTEFLVLKEKHYPEHTVRDQADPMIQVITLQSSVTQHAFGRLNHALLQLSPKGATSRRALISILEVNNRPLLPIQPSRGDVYGRLKYAPIADTVLISAAQRISQPSGGDPVFTIDEEQATTDLGFNAWYYDLSATTLTAVAAWPMNIAVVDAGDYVVFGYKEIFYDAVDFVMATPLTASTVVAWEYTNTEVGDVDSVAIVASTLVIDVTTYCNDSVLDGVEVTITHKPTNIAETVTTVAGVATTSFLGQSSPSTSITDYDVVALWRPVPDLTDGTLGLELDGSLTIPVTSMKSLTNNWDKDSVFGYAIRARIVSGVALPDALIMSQPTNGGEFYVESKLTQGIVKTIAIGSTDGSLFQFLPIAITPISEPVADPKIVIQVGSDTDWSVVDDFSNSGPSSRHAIFREDPDDGWGIIFGDGGLGELPVSGQAVKVSVRSGSIKPGDLDPNTSIIPRGGLSLVTDYTLYRGSSGYEVAEASTKASVLRFRYEVLPQLSLRAESAVTASEIVQAMTGGAANRATFTTSDGRAPFTRALFSLDSAGVRQYRVLVVGSEAIDDGSVSSADLTEAELWLNGGEVGVEIINGHGPQNTEAVVGSFIAKSLLPTVTLTVSSSDGVLAQADQILRAFFKPHSRKTNEDFRWSFGGSVPMPILFGLLWDGIPNRVFVDIEATDGATVWQDGDSVPLQPLELPILDPAYDPLVNIVIVVV